MTAGSSGGVLGQRLVVALAALAAAVAGVVGFAAYLPATSRFADADAADIAYYTLQLFVLGSTPLEQPGPLPVTLEIARFLAPAATIVAVVEAVRAVLSERLRRWSAARANGHIVVIGDDPVAHLLSRRFAANGSRVVLVSDTVGRDFGRQNDLLVVSGDPAVRTTLRSAGVHGAGTVYVCGRRSAANVAVALTVRQLAARAVTVEAEVRDIGMFAALKTRPRSAASDPDDRIWLNFFAVDELAARTLLAEESLTRGYDEAPVAVLGDGPFGQAVVRQLTRRRQGTRATPPVLVPDESVPGWLPSEPGTHAYICVPDLDLALRAALDLEGTKARRIVLCLPQAAGFDAALDGLSDGRLAVFGILDAACDTAPRDHLDELGRAIHERYVELCLAAGDTEKTNPSLVPWATLDPVLKQSNRAQANHISAKLATIGCAIVPAVDGGEPFAFDDDEIELLAELEHRRWVAERRRGGYVYGPVRNGRAHPDLVDWHELSEASRRKDLDPIAHIPELLATAGYHILRL